MDNEWNEVFRRNTLKKIKQKTKYEISDIIKRPFFNCDMCYCCVGDNPYFDNPVFVSRIRRTGKFAYHNPKYHCSENNNFFS